MGACVSFSSSPTPASSSHSQRAAAAALATVKIVNLDGTMAQLARPVVTAREALAAAAPGDDGGRDGHRASSSPRRLFLCSSDELGYDAPPRALAAGEALQPGQLYFVLPISALRRPLSAKDMAALAVRAATALATEAALAARAGGGLSPRWDKKGGAATQAAGKRRRLSTARVAPLLVVPVGKAESPPPDGGGARKDDVHGGSFAARPAVQDGERTVGKARNGAAGYRNRGSRHRATVQRLSAIAEDGE